MSLLHVFIYIYIPVDTKEAGTQCNTPSLPEQSQFAITNVESLRNSDNHNDLLSEHAG